MHPQNDRESLLLAERGTQAVGQLWGVSRECVWWWNFKDLRIPSGVRLGMQPWAGGAGVVSAWMHIKLWHRQEQARTTYSSPPG